MVSHTVPFTVAWRHVDAAGLIYYPNIFRYFEEAEHQLLARLGYPHNEPAPKGIAFPRVHVECNYLRPLQLGDSGTVTCSVTKVGEKSMTFEFDVVKYKNGKGESAGGTGGVLCAKGQIVSVTMDPATGQGVPLPTDLRAALEGWE